MTDRCSICGAIEPYTTLTADCQLGMICVDSKSCTDRVYWIAAQQEALFALEQHCLACSSCRSWWDNIHGIDRTGMNAYVPSSACCEVGQTLHAAYSASKSAEEDD